ncbi:hypothetical protein Pmani_001897 [Petrolisthes manimaculis]|uniref:DUF4503 domain-containing protein n=1 Tax=Petrolisthes manimaculis TaxID=1843537 RepID=A0AAE1QM43_9EUCA|nr:hypothetical protein Pmani_001897 [Petrolisthes manimaculis]
MKVKRKRGWDASLSNWCDPDLSLVELIPPSCTDTVTEDIAIEWSSSDDENEKHKDTQKPTGQITVPVKKLSPFVRKNKDVQESTTTVSPPRCDTSTVSKVQNSSTKNQRANEKDTNNFHEKSHQAQKVTPNEQAGDIVPVQNGIVVDPLLTINYVCDYDDDLHISQVSSSQVCGTTDQSAKSSSIVNIIECNTGNDTTNTEVTQPLSPVLGSQRIFRKSAKTVKFPSLEKFTENKEYKNNEMPGKLKGKDENTTPSASKVTNISDNLVRSTNKKRRVSSNTLHFSLQAEQCNIPVICNQGQESPGDFLKSPFSRVQSKNETETIETIHSFDDTVPVYDKCEQEIHCCKNQLQSSVSNDKPYNMKTYNAEKPQQEKEVTQMKCDAKVIIQSQFSAVRDSLLHENDITEKVVDDIIDNPMSPATTPVHHQGNDSQEDYYIDVAVTPPRNLQDDCMVPSQDSNYPSISSESLPSQATINEEVNENLKSGFMWARNLQQQTTPQKPSERDSEYAVESAKKKPKKDGEAARLRRLLVSWQSSINTWAHQISLLTLHSNTSPASSTISEMINKKSLLPIPLNNSFARIKAEKANDKNQTSPISINNPLNRIKQERISDRNPLSPMCHNIPQSRIKQEELVIESGTRVRRSPAVRNLQDLLIESPVSSPGVSSLNHIQIPMSKKYIKLQVMRVGSQLPSNSALCEVVSSSEEALQKSIKAENVTQTTEKDVSRQKRKYLVFFALQEHKIAGPLQVGDTAKVYSPWQTLDLPAHDVPVLFTSYFTLTKAPQKYKEHQRRRTIHDDHTKTLRHTVLCTWTCKCSSDENMLPSMCEARYSATTQGGPSHGHRDPLMTVPSTFTTITDTPEDPQPQAGSHTWTVMEGIERCGGASDVPVSLTTRVHRSISHRASVGEIENWELVCQDATGVFCTIKVPNRPLAKQLSDVLEGQGCTHTLTHLTILNRLTNTQNPGLFSLISSLHSSYQEAVSGDPSLRPLLRPPQTSCYCFTVTLGSTCLPPCQEEVVIPLFLPSWSLQQAFQVRRDGQRGQLSLHILYMVDSFLYVMDHTNTNHHEEASNTHASNQEDNSVITNTEGEVDSHESKDSVAGNKRSASSTNESSAVRRLIVTNRSSLPEWIPEQGTVMQRAVLKDAVVWRGNVIIDEYTCIHKEEEESVKEQLSLVTLVKVLSSLSSFTQQHDLTIVSGTIMKIDADSAYTWPTCPKCGSDKVNEVVCGGAGKEGAQRRSQSTMGVDCSVCGVRASTPTQGYSMEVWIGCRPHIENADVKVKLYQRTIEKLLNTCSTASDEGYDVESLVGLSVGPLVCVLQTVSRHKQSTSPIQYFLLEFPY